MSADDAALRAAIVAVCRRLYHSGLIAGPDGNVSVRRPDGMILVTPAGLSKVDVEPHLFSVPLSNEDRSSHLQALFRDLVSRLRNPLPLGTRALVSPSAHAHGLLRRKQGYSAAMLVEESRMLQVSIFQTLQNNLHHMDFSVLLVSVMAIADEVDSQLAQAMTSYISEAKIDISEAKIDVASESGAAADRRQA